MELSNKNLTPNSFGEYLSALRKLKGLTQQELATKTSILPSYISKIERGVIKNPQDVTINKILSVLNPQEVKNPQHVKQYEDKKLSKESLFLDVYNFVSVETGYVENKNIENKIEQLSLDVTEGILSIRKNIQNSSGLISVSTSKGSIVFDIKTLLDSGDTTLAIVGRSLNRKSDLSSLVGFDGIVHMKLLNKIWKLKGSNNKFVFVEELFTV